MRPVALVALLAALVPSPAVSVPGASTVADPGTPGESLTDLDRMGQWFEEHPDRKGRRGTGWNPYQRARWFLDQRRVDGRLPEPGARWEAWQEKRRRSEGRLPGSTWFEIGPVNLSGRILDIEVDPTNPDVVYVGSASGGLWKTLDGGDTWTPLTDELPSLAIGGIAVSPTNPNVVLIATGEGTVNLGRVGGVGILRSTDGGSTWNPTNRTYPVSSGSGFHFLETDDGSAYLAGGNDRMWRSTDEGLTWTGLAGTKGSWFDARWVPGSGTVYATGGGGAFGGNDIRMSTDDGITWTALAGGLPAASSVGKSKLAVHRAGAVVTIYAHLTDASQFGTLGIYRSTNAGASWTARNTSLDIAGGQGWYNVTIAVDPDDPNLVIAGGIENWRSTNGAVTFVETGDGFGLGTDTALHWDHHALAYEPGSTTTLWCGTDGGVWKSTDDGATWMSRREGIATYQFYDICVAQSDPDAVLGGTQDNGVPGRPGSTDSWFVSTLFADGMVCNIHPADAAFVYAESQLGNQFRSTDGGGNWTAIQSGMPANAGPWVTPVAMDPGTPTRLYCGLNGTLYRTTDGGDSWVSSSSHTATWISVSPPFGDIVWSLPQSGSPRLSTDAGVGWTTVSSYGFPVAGTGTKILADPIDAFTAYVTFSGYATGAHVVRTTDLGATWQDVSGDYPAEPANAIAVDPQFPGDWYVGSDVGVWKSTNAGLNWVPFDAALPNVVISDLEIRDAERKLVAGTYGRGAWEAAIAGSPTAAAGRRTPAPPNLMLDPPRPNPVTGFAELRFAARSPEPVRLEVFDVRGRRVGSVADLPTGDGVIRRAVWSAASVPSGVYFAVLSAGDARVGRKLVVTK